MKKTIILICSLFALILLSGCASIAPTRASRAYWEKPFSILVSNTQSVEGTKITNSLLIHKKKYSLKEGTSIILLGKLQTENYNNKNKTANEYIYFFDVLYQDLSSWAFIDKLDFKTDAGVVYLTDINPMRDVVRVTDSSLIHEFARFVISPIEIDNILNTKTLTIQFKGSKYISDVLTFSGEDLQKIKEFIKSEIITTPSKNW